MRRDRGGVAGEGAEHVDRLAVGQVVKAAAQGLAAERDRAQRLRPAVYAQVAGMAAERRFEIVAAERQEQVPQGVDRRSAPEAGAEDGVQALALRGDKGDDLLAGGRARKRGEDQEQQQVPHAVALALGTARGGPFGEGGQQGGKRHRTTSQSEKAASIQPLRHPAAASIRDARCWRSRRAVLWVEQVPSLQQNTGKPEQPVSAPAQGAAKRVATRSQDHPFQGVSVGAGRSGWLTSGLPGDHGPRTVHWATRPTRSDKVKFGRYERLADTLIIYKCLSQAMNTLKGVVLNPGFSAYAVMSFIACLGQNGPSSWRTLIGINPQRDICSRSALRSM